MIDVVVFDLAGVLLDFRGAESVARLSGGRIGRAEFDRFWGSRRADASPRVLGYAPARSIP